MPGMAASRLPQISAEVADRAHLPDLDSSRFAALSRFQCDSSGSGCGDRGKDVRDVITVPVLDAGVGVEVALGQSGVWRYFLVVWICSLSGNSWRRRSSGRFRASGTLGHRHRRIRPDQRRRRRLGQTLCRSQTTHPGGPIEISTYVNVGASASPHGSKPRNWPIAGHARRSAEKPLMQLGVVAPCAQCAPARGPPGDGPLYMHVCIGNGLRHPTPYLVATWWSRRPPRMNRAGARESGGERLAWDESSKCRPARQRVDPAGSRPGPTWRTTGFIRRSSRGRGTARAQSVPKSRECKGLYRL